MCAILFTTRLLKDLNKIIQFSKNRGPDKTSTFTIQQFNFVHQLLSITGNVTEQPFIQNNIYCIFNGEIYNFKEFGDYKSDGECLIDLYVKYDNNFINYLDGEYAIVLLDLNKNKLIFSTDVFGTKPLYYSLNENDLGIATYESNLNCLDYNNINKMEANTTFIYDLNTFNLQKQNIYTFNLLQNKTDLNDIFTALENAILKRTTNLKQKFFLGLSSGYDSGVIAACLNKYNIDYTIYTIEGREDIPTLINRHKLHKGEKFYLKNNLKKYTSHKKFIKENTEKYLYKNRPIDVTDDKGTVGVAIMCDHAIKKNIKILISGQGPDEIMSDYSIDGKAVFGTSNINTHTCFNGIFPEKLENVFPWKNFFGNSQEDYLMKEEVATGTYGIEGRYPFLDVQFVQEFLNLHHDIKNKDYKYVLKKYMEKENYPFIEKYKVGFSASHQLKDIDTDWEIIE
jgi:asparagine synthase (glutamine-hydrolysing)